MARRTTRKPARDPHYWVNVRLRMFCHLGGHEVAAGAWVRQRRGDYRHLVSCESCLAKAGVARPNRPFTSSADDTAVDVRALRSGDTE
jgi:hypothetical protein